MMNGKTIDEEIDKGIAKHLEHYENLFLMTAICVSKTQ